GGPERRRSWSRSGPAGCWRSPAMGYGRPRRQARWRATRPGRVTRWWPGSPTGWCSAARGPNGCGTRPRSAWRPPPRRWPASSAGPTMSGRWTRSRWPGWGPADAGGRAGGRLMPAAGLGTIVTAARAAGRGAGAFNVIGIEHAEAIVAGAEAAGAPVVLQISENCVAYHGALRPIGQAALAIAAAAAVPVAVHLDHATRA